MSRLAERRFAAIESALHDWQRKAGRNARVQQGRGDVGRRRHARALVEDDGVRRKVAGLYFIGEVVDVTGWLGGYNFQWAWSSGHAAGEHV